MKHLHVAALLLVASAVPFDSIADQIDDANAEIRVIVRQIQQDGPAELRSLPSSVIHSTAASFVHGRRSGLFSEALLARMGGVRKATESALQGSLKSNGSR
jgi:hypothetical protein